MLYKGCFSLIELPRRGGQAAWQPITAYPLKVSKINVMIGKRVCPFEDNLRNNKRGHYRSSYSSKYRHLRCSLRTAILILGK